MASRRFIASLRAEPAADGQEVAEGAGSGPHREGSPPIGVAADADAPPPLLRARRRLSPDAGVVARTDARGDGALLRGVVRSIAVVRPGARHIEAGDRCVRI